MNYSFGYKLLLIVSLLVVLLGCSEEQTEKEMLKQAVAIENSDECHLCGMIISQFPGPKGELYQKTSQDIAKFCSTRDLFGYLLQPENQRQVEQVFVHDMSKTPWGKQRINILLMLDPLGSLSILQKKARWVRLWQVLVCLMMPKLLAVSMAVMFIPLMRSA